MIELEYPKNWSCTRLKNVALVNENSLSTSTHSDYILNYLEISNVNNRGIISKNEIRELFFSDAPSRARRIVCNGDTVISSVRPNLQAIAHIEHTTGNLIASTGFYVVTPNQARLDEKYTYYLLISDGSRQHLEAVAKGVGYPAVDDKDFVTLTFLLPSLEEQKAIASYLDKTCAAIDKAIEAKQKQLEILDALRKSIIHKAVTRGLDDSVELKDSGVEWLGRISKHWFITKLKNQCQIIPSNVDKKSHDDETEVRLCNYVDVYYNEFIDNSIEYMVATANEHELKKFQLLEGDVLVTKDSEDPYDIAVPALVVETRPKLLCGYHLSIIRSNNQKFNGSYLFWALKDVSIASQLHREATGITRWAIANKHIKNSLIPLPPDAEQKLIASYLIKKCVELSRLHENIKQQISTLEQYRKSLIHECVTGKRRVTEDDVQDQV